MENWNSNRRRYDHGKPDQTARSQRDRDLLGIDNGHKARRDLCGDPKVLTPEEIEKLSIKHPWPWVEKQRRKRRYDIP